MQSITPTEKHINPAPTINSTCASDSAQKAANTNATPLRDTAAPAASIEITTAKDELLTVEAGRELEKACDELAKEISEIIDVYNGKFTDIIRKGKEIKDE